MYFVLNYLTCCGLLIVYRSICQAGGYNIDTYAPPPATLPYDTLLTLVMKLMYLICYIASVLIINRLNILMLVLK